MHRHSRGRTGLYHMAASMFVIVTATCPPPVPAAAQDADAGRHVFQSRCGICHTAQPGRNLVGPSLFGVVGRPSGHAPGFHYSTANLSSGLTWDPATLDRYLTAPRQVVPGTLMTFPGIKDAQTRADVIAYLATLH
jgi:cytochrome c